MAGDQGVVDRKGARQERWTYEQLGAAVGRADAGGVKVARSLR